MTIKEVNNYRVINLIDGDQIKEAAELINQDKADGVNFNFIRNFPKTIDEIRTARNIKHIVIHNYPKSWDFDYSVINNLHTLEILNVYTDDRNEINYFNYPKLKRTALYWRPKAKSLFECRYLKELFIGKYTSTDLLNFEKLNELEYLRINTGSIRSLDGINNLHKIKSLYIMQATKLEDISGLAELKNLELIYIDNCKRINNIKSLLDLNSKVKISLNGSTPSLNQK